MAERDEPVDDQEAGGDRWLVVDERRWDFIMMTTRVLHDRSLDAYGIAAYAGLAAHADRASGQTWCSLETIAKYLVCSLTTAREAIRCAAARNPSKRDLPCSKAPKMCLVHAGYIRVTDRPGRSAMIVLVDSKELPGPAAPGTPTPDGGVDGSGARANSQVTDGPETGSERPLARAKSDAAPPPTPVGGAGVSSTTPAPATGDPSSRRRGTRPRNETATPLPPAGFDAPRSGRNRVNDRAEFARANGSDQGGCSAMTAALGRARTLGSNMAALWRAGEVDEDYVAASIRRDCANALARGQAIDTDTVVAAGLTALRATPPQPLEEL